MPKIYGADIDKINELRKAGLGLLGSIVGDDKAADSIEDTAVELSDLPNYIADFSAMMERHGQRLFIMLMPVPEKFTCVLF